MNENDLFIYNFIFELGRFYPLDISLLGGRFYASYSHSITNFSQEDVDLYKGFLQDKLSKANGLISSSDNQSYFFISWIIAFIEYELVNYGYRNLHKHFFTRTDFSFVLAYIIDHTFLDHFFIEISSDEKQLQAFLARHSSLLSYLQFLLNNLSELSFSSLLEAQYICSNIKYMYEAYELTNFGQNLIDNKNFVQQKASNLHVISTLNSKITSLLLNYIYSDLEIKSKKEIFLKSVEYNISSSKVISEDELKIITDKISEQKDFMISKKIIDANDENYIKKLSEISFKTKLSSDEILSTSQQIYNEISDFLIEKSIITEKKPLDISFNSKIGNFLGHGSRYVSSQRTKRGEPAKYVLQRTECSLSALYGSIITEIMLYHYVAERNNSSSYVYQVAKVYETEKAIKLFLKYIFLDLYQFNSVEVQGSFFLAINNLLNLSKLDVECFLQGDFNRSKISQQLLSTTNISEINSEHYLDKLVLLPGYYFLVFEVFSSLNQSYSELKEKYNSIIAFKKIFSFLSGYYGAPVKIFLEGLKKVD